MNSPITLWQLRLPILVCFLAIVSEVYLSSVPVIVRLATLVGGWVVLELYLASKSATRSQSRQPVEMHGRAVVRQPAAQPAQPLVPNADEPPRGAEQDYAGGAQPPARPQ
jgi:hypothetical protein